MKNKKNTNNTKIAKDATKNSIFMCLLLMAALLSMPNVAYAWINGNGSPSTDPNNPVIGTHDRLLESAVNMLPSDMRKKVNITVADYGTEMPDYNNTMCNCTYGIRDQKYHQIYYRSNGSVQDDSSARRAQEEYDLAKKNLSIGDEYNFSIHVGMMSHYIVEVGNFAHTMGNDSEWGNEGSHTHSDYENYVAGNYTKFFGKKNMKFDGTYDNISAYNATLALANDSTFDNKFGNGTHTNVWMDNMINDSVEASYTFATGEFENRTRQSINYSANLLADVMYVMLSSNVTSDPVVTPNVTATPVPNATATPVPTTPKSSGSSGSSSGSSGSSGGSSGGGGGLGTAEPYANVLKYEVQEHAVYITPVSFKYVTPELGMYDVLVTSNQSNIASLRIEVLKGTSKLVGKAIDGAVYKNINAWMDYKRIKNATIRFKVPNSWIGDNGLGENDVRLSKWDNVSKEWIELGTSVTGKDGTYTYFETGVDVLSGSYVIGHNVGNVGNVGNFGDENVGTGDGQVGTGVNSDKGSFSKIENGNVEDGNADNGKTQKSPGFEMLVAIGSVLLAICVFRRMAK